MTKVNFKIKFLAIATVAISLGCSKVGFTPTDPEAMSNGDMDKTETFLFNKNNLTAKVDILIVNDNSGSMANAQNKLGNRLRSFIDSLGNLDWQIGITTTDVSTGALGLQGSLLPYDGTGLRVLNKNVPNYEQLFFNTIVREETAECAINSLACPSPDERGMEAMIMAIGKRNTVNQGMFRSNADLVVIELTNEDEGSTGSGVNLKSATDVIAAVSNAFGPKKPFTAFGIIVKPGDSSCISEEGQYGGRAAVMVAELANLTGGLNGSICDSDYTDTLESIGQRVRDGIRTITLKYTPTTPESVVVTITPADPSLTWELVGRQIIFNKPPAQFTRVDVDYVH